MSKRKFSGSINGKVYYIALILCAVAIGISGYLYYRNTDDTPAQLGKKPTPTNASADNHEVQAVATQGADNHTDALKPAEATAAAVEQTLKTTMPVSGQMVAQYAMDCLSYNQTTRDWRVHNGIDLAAESGTPVVAAADGTVYTVYEDDTMGKTVVIRHRGGYTTQYASLAQEVSVVPGDKVVMGQEIGCVGSSALLETAIGDHVHFSVTCNDKNMDPVDFLPAE